MQKIQFNCTICLNQLTDPTCLSCGHTFCEKCVNQHLKINHICPLCRKPTLPDWPINEMLKEVLAIYSQDGEEVLRTEFPQIVLCLDCGLTPVNPIVLPCQHLFCYQCYENDLIQQYCPVCMQQCMVTDPIVNIVFSQLLQWYCETEEKIIYKDLKRECMPIFLFDKQICYKRNFSLRIIEDRYKQLIKLASHGSGKFPIVPFTDKLPIYADLVEIVSITDCIEIIGTDRLIISQIYCFINDQKIPFTPNTFKALPKQLWLCDYTTVRDTQDKSSNWNKIKQFLYLSHQELNTEMKALFDKPFQLMNIFTNKINSLNASLILIQLLKINNQQFQKLYYSNDENFRNQFIWNFMNQIQQKIIHMIGSQADYVKAKGGQMIEQEIEMPNLQFSNIYEEEEDDFEEEIQMLNHQFSNMTLSQQVILNLFHLHRIPLFQ